MADETSGPPAQESAEPTGGEQSSAEQSGADIAAQRAAGGTRPSAGEPEQAGDADPRTAGGCASPARAAPGSPHPPPARARHVRGQRLRRHLRLRRAAAARVRPGAGRAARSAAGSTRFADEFADALTERDIPRGAVQQITVDRGEITFYVQRERVLDLCRTLRDDEGLRFELCSSVSGVDYGEDVEQRLHVVYHLLSMTYRRRIRLEVALDVDDPHLPSVVEVYPTADWHERETWDMFGVIFDGHPALTRILMPDDWDGHPQRKDYPLGGIPVEYKGAEIPPPDQRRSYT